MQAEQIGASSMRIARKTAKLFTCLGISTQLGQSIVPCPQVPLQVLCPRDALVLDPVQLLVPLLEMSFVLTLFS